MKSQKCVSWNVQSIRNKCGEVLEHVTDHDADIVFLSETWMEADTNDITAAMKASGYTLIHNRRRDRDKEKGGGVGIMVKSTVSHKHTNGKAFSSFEHTMVRVKLTNNTKLTLVTIYRLQFISAQTFIQEFTELLEMLSIMPENFVLSGDINFHLETNEHYAVLVKDLFETFNLVQHVDFPTHKKGHTLDLLLTRKDTLNISDLHADDVELSDHFMMLFKIEAEVIKHEERTIIYRNFKDIDTKSFMKEAKERMQGVTDTTFGEKITKYNLVMKELVNNFAPLKEKTIKVVPKAPWFDTEYVVLRKARRKAEKKYKSSKTEANKKCFVDLRKQTTDMAFHKKREYYSNKISNSNGTKALYSCVNELLDKKKSSVLPSHTCSKELASRFNTYFKEKIKKIRESFPPHSAKSTASEFTGTYLEEFKPATEEEIRTIIKDHGLKCSPEDPVPAQLLKTCTDMFIPIWLDLVNLSLEQGSIECLKSAVLLPLIKELDSAINTEILKNYRPVSNLQFLGKLIERVVGIRLDDHMVTNNLHSSKQYGYKIDHSTELLMTKVVNDLLLGCDKKLPSLVMFLDLSAAFDTVDQNKLLDILHDQIGVRGTALKWFSSFLLGRTQKVKIGGEFSTEETLDFGVPQGSILGPKLFNIYAKPFPDELEVVSVSVEGYADDHQLQKLFNLNFQVQVLGEGISKTFDVIESWMRNNFLKLNSGKTKIMIVAPEGIKHEIIINGTFINGDCVRFVDCAKNLGVLIDSTLTFDSQVQKVVSICFNTLRQLARIKHFLNNEQLQQLVCSLVLQRIDYCNILYYGLKSETINKLQSVQNSAARLVCKVNRYDRVGTDELFLKLHWLKVKERITFKMLVTVHKCVNRRAPVALMSMLGYSSSDRTKKLESQKCNGKMGDRAFSVAGPRLWNALPLELRLQKDVEDFKKMLKTYLFKNSYSFYEIVNRK